MGYAAKIIKNTCAFALCLTIAGACVPAQSLAFAATATTQVSSAESVTGDQPSQETNEVAASMPAVAAQNLSDSSISILVTATQTQSVGNGWQINFEVTQAGAAVVGVAQAGSGALEIPATLGGAKVVEIASDAFENQTQLTQITLPQTVATIGNSAFRNTGLTSFTMPNSVTELGVSALRDNASLRTCTLSSSLATIGAYAFKNSTALVAIALPASLDRVSYGCFTGCSALEQVTFEGSTMRYIHREAFMNCTSLAQIELPLLTAYPSTTEASSEGLLGNTDFSATIGARCFYGCTSLAKIVLGGPVMQNSKTIFASSDCLLNTASDLTVVYLGTRSAPSYGTATSKVYVSNEYCTLDFYNSETDAAQSVGKVASATYQTRIYDTSGSTMQVPIKLLALINGWADYSELAYGAQTSIPAAPAGKVWGVVAHPTGTTTSSSNIGNTLTYNYYNASVPFIESYQVVAVDKADVYYGWVDSPVVSAFYEAQNTGTASTSNSSNSSAVPSFALSSNGTCAELDNLYFRAADGSTLDASSYDLCFERAIITTTTTGSITNTTTEWVACTRADVNTDGTYRVYAKGKGAYANRVSSATQFTLSTYKSNVVAYADASSLSAQIGAVASDTGLLMSGAGAQAQYTVVAGQADWAAQLVGAGVAGAAAVPGQVLIDCADDYDAASARGHIYSGASRYIVVGSESSVALTEGGASQDSLANYVASLSTRGGTRFGGGATTAQALASSVCANFTPANWGAAWGTTVVVASATDELAASAAMQYVYEAGARVVFLNASGQLDTADLAMLKSQAIQNVVLLGDNSSVSDVVASIIALSTGKTPTRILENSNTTQGSIELAQQLILQKYAEGVTSINFVISDASSSANCASAAAFAHWADAVCITCSSTADFETIQRYLQTFIASSSAGAKSVGSVYTIGTFDYMQTDTTAALESALGGAVLTSSVKAGTTFELDGAIYKLALTASGALQASVQALPGMLVENVPATVELEGVTYCTSVQAENVFADLEAGAWYLSDAGHNWINEVFAKNIMTGYGSTNNFGPNDTVTRAQAATILYRYYTGDTARLTYENASTVQNTSGLTDVAGGQYYTAAVNWATQAGIITGYTDTQTFAPNSAVTRQELAVMIARLAKFAQGSAYVTASTSVLNTKADASDVTTWAREGCAWCAANGIMTGGTSNQLNPSGSATRAQMAKMVCVLAEILEGNN